MKKPVSEIEERFSPEPFEGSRPIVRITFVGQGVIEPLITIAARKFGADFIIRQADIETVKDKSMGFLMVEPVGDQEAIEKALAFIQESVQLEVVGYVN